MKLRVAKKIMAAVGTDRQAAYSNDQIGRACQIIDRTPEQRKAEAYWHNLMAYLGPAGRAEVVASWSPSTALDILMRTPESQWEGDDSKLVELANG